ncbi:MAG: endolytic transglycosylase MltG [Spirochaetes bacterium]|nr:endolytic transglycosylase MltG [Spirochaetota bacterium]
MKKATVLVVLFLIFFSIPAAFFLLSRPTGNARDVVYFEIKRNDTLSKVAKELVATNLIVSDKFFVKYAQFSGQDTRMQAGYYELNRGMSAIEIVKLFNEGKVALEKFAVPEGKNIYEIAKILAAKKLVEEPAFIAACYDKALLARFRITSPSFEGYLFPSTYYIARGHTAESYVELMATNFFKTFNRADVEKRAKELGVTFEQVVSMASIVEKEAGSPDERPLIAAVYYNRLKDGKICGYKLQSCPTVIYAMTLVKGAAIERPNIRESDILMRHPYNTYIYRNIPPGPIANPSKASMDAALYPSKVDYLFFCSDNKGHNVFSRDYRVHENYVRIYQKGGR